MALFGGLKSLTSLTPVNFMGEYQWHLLHCFIHKFAYLMLNRHGYCHSGRHSLLVERFLMNDSFKRIQIENLVYFSKYNLVVRIFVPYLYTTGQGNKIKGNANLTQKRGSINHNLCQFSKVQTSCMSARLSSHHIYHAIPRPAQGSMSAVRRVAFNNQCTLCPRF